MLKMLVWLVVVGVMAICGAAPSFSGLEESQLPPEDYIMENHSHNIVSSSEEVPRYLSENRNSAQLQNYFENESAIDESGDKIYETGEIVYIHRVARSPSIISEALLVPQTVPVSLSNLKSTPNENIIENRFGLTGTALLNGNANILGFDNLVGQFAVANGQFNNLGNQAGQAGGLLLKTKADTGTSFRGVVGTAKQQLDNANTEVGKTGGLLIRGKAEIAGSLTGEANKQFNNLGQQVGQAGGLLFNAKADAASSLGDITGVVSTQVDNFGEKVGKAGGLLVMAMANAAGSLGGVVGMVTRERDNFNTQVGQTGGVLIKGKASVASSLSNLSTKPITGRFVLPFK